MITVSVADILLSQEQMQIIWNGQVNCTNKANIAELQYVNCGTLTGPEGTLQRELEEGLLG